MSDSEACEHWIDDHIHDLEDEAWCRGHLSAWASAGHASPLERLRDICETLLQRHALTQAGHCYRVLTEHPDSSPEDLFNRAACAMQFRGLARNDHYWRPSLELFRVVTKRNPAHVAAWMNIGHYWLNALQPIETGEWRTEAEGAFRNVIKTLNRWGRVGHFPQEHQRRYRQEALLGLAHLSMASGDARGAADSLMEILAHTADHAVAHCLLRWPDIWRALAISEREVVIRSRSTPIEPSCLVHALSSPEGIEECIQTLHTYGAVLIRGFFPRQPVDRFHQKHRDTLLHHRRHNEGEAWRLEKVEPRDDASSITVDLSHLIDGSLLPRLITLYSEQRHPGWSVIPHQANHIQLRDETDQRPEPIHQDHPVHGKQSTFLTCWIPLTPCGNGLAPGVELYLERFQHPVHLKSEFPAALNGLPDGFILEHLHAHRFVPHFEPGDLLVFDPMLFHKTETLSRTEYPRISCDLRFQSGPSAFGYGDQSQSVVL
ncbi:MAG: hypothetical protein HQL50_00435 [Magnetococcales bacterium]|nr:hypothetical protein [Magnetococcales bacterium]